MLGALVFQRKRKLYDQFAVPRLPEYIRELRIGQGIAVIVRVQPDAGHAMDFVTAAQIFAPSRRLRIYRSERHKKTRPGRLACFCEAGVRGGEIAMEYSVKTGRPCLHDVAALETR